MIMDGSLPTVIIDRQRWLRGETGSRLAALRRRNGKREYHHSALGFACAALGMPPSMMVNRSTLTRLVADRSPGWFEKYRGLLDPIWGRFYVDVLVAENDDDYIAPKKLERNVATALRRLGFRVRFVN